MELKLKVFNNIKQAINFINLITINIVDPRKDILGITSNGKGEYYVTYWTKVI